MKLKPFPFWSMHGTSGSTPPQPKRHKVNGALATRILRGIKVMKRTTANNNNNTAKGN